MIPIPEFGKPEYSEATLTEFARKCRLRTRRDADGTVVIIGKHGQIFQYDDGVLGVLVMPSSRRPRYWGYVKRQLLACGFEIRLDCDGEGVAAFTPGNTSQAVVATKAAGIKPIRIKSAAQLEAAKRGLKAANAAKDRLKSATEEGLRVVDENASTRQGAGNVALPASD